MCAEGICIESGRIEHEGMFGVRRDMYMRMFVQRTDSFLDLLPVHFLQTHHSVGL